MGKVKGERRQGWVCAGLCAEARHSTSLENRPFLTKQDSISQSRQIFGSKMTANEWCGQALSTLSERLNLGCSQGRSGLRTCPWHRGTGKEPTSHLGWFSLSVSGRFRSCLCLTVCLTEMATTHFWLPVSYNIPCTWQQPCCFAAFMMRALSLRGSWKHPIPKHWLVNGHLQPLPGVKVTIFCHFPLRGSQANSPSPESLQSSSSLLGAASFYISALLLAFTPRCSTN